MTTSSREARYLAFIEECKFWLNESCQYLPGWMDEPDTEEYDILLFNEKTDSVYPARYVPYEGHQNAYNFNSLSPRVGKKDTSEEVLKVIKQLGADLPWFFYGEYRLLWNKEKNVVIADYNGFRYYADGMHGESDNDFIVGIMEAPNDNRVLKVLNDLRDWLEEGNCPEIHQVRNGAKYLEW